MEGKRNLENICEVFDGEASRLELRGVLGITGIESVYNSLLPVQQELLKGICGERFKVLLRNGSVVSIAYAYPDKAIDAIAVKKGDAFDKDKWNTYARWYRPLNEALNDTAKALAEETDGIAIPATVAWIDDVKHVEDYYGMAVSHRVAAEQAGTGWRGKNELVVNPRYGCAIRLASVVTVIPLERTHASYEGCGGCRSCLEACPFLGQKETLDNYREQCRRYINALGLVAEVCGKCIKACTNSSTFKDVRGRRDLSETGSVHYTK